VIRPSGYNPSGWQLQYSCRNRAFLQTDVAQLTDGIATPVTSARVGENCTKWIPRTTGGYHENIARAGGSF
jgi:hypothetical protein